MASGYTALKTNVLLLGDNPRAPRRRASPAATSFPELNADRARRSRAIRDQLAAFREGAGPDVDILVDLNFNYKTEGFLKMARAMEPFDLFWVEIDTRDAEALRYIREPHDDPGGLRASASSAGATTGRSSSSSAMDVAIIDVPVERRRRVARRSPRMADAYEVNVAPAQLLRPPGDDDERALRGGRPEPPHHGDRPRRRALAGRPGHREAARSRTATCTLPTGPGWGTEVDEEAVRAHPPRE